jgi:hypothetical protein
MLGGRAKALATAASSAAGFDSMVISQEYFSRLSNKKKIASDQSATFLATVNGSTGGR